ncbi:MAG: hypothetical protein QM784_30550 [Polyangiaceae bacterium]
MTDTKLNELVKGKVATRPWECDIHGVCHSVAWKIVRYVSIAVLVVGGAAILLPEYFGDTTSSVQGAGKELESAVSSATGYSIEGFGLVIIGIVTIITSAVGAKRSARHVWVECKDRKTPIKRTDIIKVVEAVEDVRANDQSAWIPNEIWFAATSSFDVDATNFAQEKGVRCVRAMYSNEGDQTLTVSSV